MKPCTLYKNHRCAVIENHHICPKSWWEAAGKPINTPMAVICPNCHMDVHWAIDNIIHGGTGYGVSPRCIKLAQQAMKIAAANGLTPALTL